MTEGENMLERLTGVIKSGFAHDLPSASIARLVLAALMEPTPGMLEALMDPQSPFVGRRKMDKSGGEVVELLNADWRDTIPASEDDFAHHGDFRDEREAIKAAERLSTAWRYRNALRTASIPNEEGEGK